MVRNSLVPVHSGGFLERDFGRPFLSLHREMTHLFDDVFHGRSGDRMQDSSPQHGPMMPSIDVSETDNEVRISADLPGVSESDVDVSLVDDILTIRAEKKLEKKDEKENYITWWSVPTAHSCARCDCLTRLIPIKFERSSTMACLRLR